MATSFTFGDFRLDSSNYVHVHVVREKSPAERTLGLLAPARARGLSLVSITPKAKIIEIEGTITGGEQSLQTFTDSVRDFVAAFQNQVADFLIATTDGTYVYEECVCQNPESMLRGEAHWNIDFIPFRIELLATKGVALDTEVTTHSFLNISQSPYTNFVTIPGTAPPDPWINLTLDSTGGAAISKMRFLNRETQEAASISTVFASDDIVQIDTKEKVIRYNTRPKRFSGLLPRFILGDNNFRVEVESSTTLHQSQESSDDDRAVFGNTHLTQRINPDENISVSQIDVLIQKFEKEKILLQMYDDFSGSLNAAKWTTTGQVTVNESGNGIMRLYSERNGTPVTSTAHTSGKSGGFGINGGKWFQANAGGTSAGAAEKWCEITDGTNAIRIVHLLGTDKMIVRTAGTYNLEGGAAFLDRTEQLAKTSAVVEIKESGSDVQVLIDGELKLTLANHSIEASSYFRAQADSLDSTEDRWLVVDNVQFYLPANATAVSDLTVELQTSSGGLPSGTAVANGSATIKAADISNIAYTIVPVTFKDKPALTADTDYHIVLSQTGGDIDNYYAVKINTSGGYSQGEVAVSTDGGTTWTQKTGEDLWFRLLGDFPTNFNLDLDINYFITHHSVV